MVILHKLKVYADAILDRQIDELCAWARSEISLPVYADNTAAKAGGLVAKQKYRTATGVVMVVY